MKSGHDTVPGDLLIKAREANIDDVALGIENRVLPLIHQDKHIYLFRAIKDILKGDTTIADATNVGVMPGYEKSSILNHASFYEASHSV